MCWSWWRIALCEIHRYWIVKWPSKAYFSVHNLQCICTDMAIGTDVCVYAGDFTRWDVCWSCIKIFHVNTDLITNYSNARRFDRNIFLYHAFTVQFDFRPQIEFNENIVYYVLWGNLRQFCDIVHLHIIKTILFRSFILYTYIYIYIA